MQNIVPEVSTFLEVKQTYPIGREKQVTKSRLDAVNVKYYTDIQKKQCTWLERNFVHAYTYLTKHWFIWC